MIMIVVMMIMMVVMIIHDYYGNDIVKVRGFIPSLARQLLTGLATLLTAGLPLLFFRYPSFLLEHHAP